MHGHGHVDTDDGYDTAVIGRRAWGILGALLACVLVATAAGLVVLWPAYAPPSALAASVAGTETDTVQATVVSVSAVACAGTSEDRLPDGSVPATVVCASAVMRIGSGPDRGRRVKVSVPTPAYTSGLTPGERVQLVRYPASPQDSQAPTATDVSPAPSTAAQPASGARPTPSASAADPLASLLASIDQQTGGDDVDVPDGAQPVPDAGATNGPQASSGTPPGATRTPATSSGGDGLIPAVDGVVPGGGTYAWVDFSRQLPLGLLAAAFAGLVLVVARFRGLAALGGLGLGWVAIEWFMLPALRDHENALAVALVGSVSIMTVILYLAHGFSAKTTTALLGTVAGLSVCGGLGQWVVHAAHLSGVTSEDTTALTSLIGQADLSSVVVCGVVIAGLGVLNDVTVTQASAVWEVRRSAPHLRWPQLFSSGMRVGRDHLASTVYTIVFAYAGAALPTLLLVSFYQRPFLEVVNSGEIAEAVASGLVGAVGLVLAIPLTTLVASLVASTSRTPVEAPIQRPEPPRDPLPVARPRRDVLPRLIPRTPGGKPSPVLSILSRDAQRDLEADLQRRRQIAEATAARDDAW